MVNRIRSYISRHSFYYRILIPFSMVSILAILLTASTAWRIMGNKIDDQMKESVTHRLEQVRIYSDNYIYEQMMNILVNSFIPSDTFLLRRIRPFMTIIRFSSM